VLLVSTSSTIATTLYYPTHIYIAALLHSYSINSVLHLPSPLYVRASDHIERQARDDAYAASRRNKLLDAPAWMRSGGLIAADWAVITEYIAVLKPLKEATRSLEARGTSGSFGAIYEVYPVYEAVVKAYETALEP
jgi:hypothetical protein